MSAPAPSRRELAISVALFGATLLSCTLMYAFLFADGAGTLGAPQLRQGLQFGSALMGILLAHEMGHYVVARMHGFSLSLPVFIPFPNIFGTLGAVIRLKTLPRSRQALLEMGAAGPLAGGVVAIVLLWISLRWAQPAPVLPPGETVWIFQDPLLLRLIGYLTTGAALDPYAVYHPVSMAGWVGCFLTGVNMLPIGQLDGGHVFNALLPRQSRIVSRIGALLLIAAGFWWPGWVLLGGLLLVFSAGRPLPVDPDRPLPNRARLVAACALVLFGLTFVPVPLVQQTLAAGP